MPRGAGVASTAEEAARRSQNLSCTFFRHLWAHFWGRECGVSNHAPRALTRHLES